ncbi:DUF4843 domain-containing protein [Sphingobacterium paucimobilis]|uniref:DUF4843 domain-containing protein n=1 Tax=Sphingobacterium paucimobilis HER1398 TaxID=1346330 RepID=U2HRJ8_9SPHI|nr:DUF4843 domain-containing protein [Sphingobacterium paucimobilis]ERJ57920.1 hypothetical protein M472_03985 [Sphingobacterium paucimobilis HER1398]
MIHKLYLSVVLLFILCACSKNEYITYTEKNALIFKKGEDLTTADSLVYSFISKAVQGDFDTVWIPIALTGLPNDSNRSFELELDKESTALESKHFRLTETVFPKGEIIMNYPIVLLRSEDLASKRQSFKLSIKENENFGVGAKSFDTYPGITIHVVDQVIKPSWWASAENYYYGIYSHAKYRFMIEVVGISDFSQKSLSFPQIMNYRAAFKAAITEYEKEHGGPLLDENKQVVTFP